MSNAECNKNNIRQLSYKFILTYLASIEPKNYVLFIGPICLP